MIFCPKGLHDFLFCFERLHDFFPKRLHDFFGPKWLRYFFLFPRGCMTFFVLRSCIIFLV